MNSGYSGHGILCSPAGWRILADLITSTPEHLPFALDRVFVRGAWTRSW